MQPTPFGSYELLEKIAIGGMAEVFRARAIRAGGVTKTVCLKRIHPNLCADPSFVDMFIEEARLGLTLSHGNIVPVFDFGCIDGHHFIVMDYVGGRDLSSVMARGRIVSRPFPADLAVFVVMEVLEGLAYAHGHRDESGRKLELVHRDVSPSNVMISGAGEVKILDFGIARSALREFRTRTGVVKGKPGYMAPEQALGEAVDERADIFACGVLLHELLTDRRPFADDDSVASPPDNAVRDRELAAVVEQALEEDAADRFGSAREMSEALAETLDEAGLRPTAATLADHVEELFGAKAATPDWSLGDAVDRHLAAQVDTEKTDDTEPTTAPIERPPREGLKRGDGDTPVTVEVDPPTAPATPPAGGEEPRTRRIERSMGPAGDRGGGNGRGRWVALSLVALLVAGGVVAAASVMGPEELPPSPPPGPVEPAEPEPATVEVRTQPAGASVLLDGEEVEGTSPMDLSIPPGRHDIEVRLAGFGTLRRSVMARAGQLVAMDVALQSASGRLEVVSEPPGATVLLDGGERGQTPLVIEDLDRESNYGLEVTLDGYLPWSSPVSLDGRRRHRVRAVLARPRRDTPSGTGLLSVNAHPWAEVVVDGRPLGQTPVVRHALPAGRHRVVLRNAARGAEVTRWVVIRADQEQRVVVDLTASSGQGAP